MATAFKDQTRHVLNSMMGYISLPAILQKIMQVGRPFSISFNLRCDRLEILFASFTPAIKCFLPSTSITNP